MYGLILQLIKFMGTVSLHHEPQTILTAPQTKQYLTPKRHVADEIKHLFQHEDGWPYFTINQIYGHCVSSS